VTIEEPSTVIIEGSNSEETPSETVIEEEHSDAVAVAEIEANRDIALAAIHSETEQARIEVEAERIEAIAEGNKEYDECRQEIQRLTGIVESLSERVNSLIPQPVLEVVETVEELPTAEETNLIPQSTVVPTAETQTEPSEESAEERAEEAIPSRVRKFIAI